VDPWAASRNGVLSSAVAAERDGDRQFRHIHRLSCLHASEKRSSQMPELFRNQPMRESWL